MAFPVLISVYTRLRHLQKCIESLSENDLAKETDLFIVSDAAKYPQHEKKIEEVRDYVSSINGFKSVNLFAWDENKGSAESIRLARMKIFESYDAQIFMEDDNIVSPFFLKYMNESLEKYSNNENVFGVCGFNFNVIKPEKYPLDTYFADAISANGWGYWKNKYMKFFNGYRIPDFKAKSFKLYEKKYQKPANNLKRMVSQGVVWGDTKVTHYLYENHMVCLFPCISLVQNTGWDGSGEHCGKDSSQMEQLLSLKPVRTYPENLEIDPLWEKALIKNFAYPFFGKYKTALYDFYTGIKKNIRKNNGTK